MEIVQERRQLAWRGLDSIIMICGCKAKPRKTQLHRNMTCCVAATTILVVQPQITISNQLSWPSHSAVYLLNLLVNVEDVCIAIAVDLEPTKCSVKTFLILSQA